MMHFYGATMRNTIEGITIQVNVYMMRPLPRRGPMIVSGRRFEDTPYLLQRTR